MKCRSRNKAWLGAAITAAAQIAGAGINYFQQQKANKKQLQQQYMSDILEMQNNIGENANNDLNNYYDRVELVPQFPYGGNTNLKPNIVRGGRAIDLGNNLYLMSGRKHSQGGIDIGKNPKTGIEVEGNEVVQTTPSSLRVFSAQPILGGISPAEYILGGANPNKVFAAQENWKRINRVDDDGTKYITGGKIDKGNFKTVLNKRNEEKFQNWYKNVSTILNIDSDPDNPFHAYDYRGYWLENRNKDIDYTQPDFHFTDKYKQPTHETFSIESQYAKKKYGINPESVGHWDGETFIPGKFNDLMSINRIRNNNDTNNNSEYIPSENIINYIKSTEGFRDKWYQDGKGIWTVGYGFTGSKVRKMFPNGMTREQADKYLADSLNIRKQILQRDTPNWDSLNQNQRDALLSYHYNIGEGNYRNSPKMQEGLRNKDWELVTKNIDYGYNDSNNRGLRKRREYERALFNTEPEYKYGGRKIAKIGIDDESDFKSIKQREDFEPTLFKKFIVDKFGSKFYPNPIGIHGDFSRFYFGRKTNNNTFYKSNYKPTKSKNEDAVYYGVKDIRFLNNLVALYNSENNKLTEVGKNQNLFGYKARDPVITAKNKALVSELPENYNRKTDEYMLSEGVASLGNFTVGRGKDEKGEYLSYYDLWDTNQKFSHNIEKRGLAKPYEIYDRIYGTFDKDGTFHPEGEIGESYIAYEKKYGGIHIKPSKRGTFTAAAKKHGMGVQAFASKVLANKDDYSPAMVKKANFARNASKWNHKEFGGNMDFNYIIGKNNIYKLGGRRKAVNGLELYPFRIERRNLNPITTQDIHLGLPLYTANQNYDNGDYEDGIIYNRYGPRFNTLLDESVVVADRVNKTPDLTFANKENDDYMANLNLDDDINIPNTSLNLDTSLKVNPMRYKQRNRGYKSRDLKGDKVTFDRNEKNRVVNPDGKIGSDEIGLGINLLGNLASSLINNKTINSLDYGNAPLPLRAVKLKTRYNINPQLDNIREEVARGENDITQNTASSKTALSRRQSLRGRGLQYANQLEGQKENIETELINRDRFNQQQIGNRNIERFNNWYRGLVDFENNRRNLKAENAVAGINNAADAIAGPQGYMAHRERRLDNDMKLKRDLLDLRVLSLLNPNAKGILDPEMKKAFDEYERLLRRRRGTII